MKSYAKIGSARQVPHSKLRYSVVVPPFMADHFCCFSKISIQQITFFPKPNFCKTDIRKPWLRESKAFSISIVTRKPTILNQPLISVMSEIKTFSNCFLHKQFVMKKLMQTQQFIICLKQLQTKSLCQYFRTKLNISPSNGTLL